MKKISLVLLTILLSALSWIVTSRIMAKSDDQNSAPKLHLGIISHDSAEGAEAANLGTVPVKPSSSFSIVKIQSNSIGNRVEVSAEAEISADPSFSAWRYTWRMLVMKGDEVVVRRLYHEQTFAMDASGAMQPTFSEALDLPIGEYLVVISLHRIENPKVDLLQAATYDPKSGRRDRTKLTSRPTTVLVKGE